MMKKSGKYSVTVSKETRENKNLIDMACLKIGDRKKSFYVAIALIILVLSSTIFAPTFWQLTSRNTQVEKNGNFSTTKTESSKMTITPYTLNVKKQLENNYRNNDQTSLKTDDGNTATLRNINREQLRREEGKGACVWVQSNAHTDSEKYVGEIKSKKECLSMYFAQCADIGYSMANIEYFSDNNSRYIGKCWCQKGKDLTADGKRCCKTVWAANCDIPVFPWNCKDDENWRDPYYIKFGHGTRRCADLTYDSCRDSIKMYDNGSVYYDYYTELMRACPKSCGLCK